MSYQLINDNKNLPNIVNMVNKNIYELKGQEVTRIFKDTTGKRRIIIGKLPDGTYGLVISKPGFDVIEVLGG